MLNQTPLLRPNAPSRTKPTRCQLLPVSTICTRFKKTGGQILTSCPRNFEAPFERKRRSARFERNTTRTCWLGLACLRVYSSRKRRKKRKTKRGHCGSEKRSREQVKQAKSGGRSKDFKSKHPASQLPSGYRVEVRSQYHRHPAHRRKTFSAPSFSSARNEVEIPS